MKKRIFFYVFGFPPDFSGATTQAIKLSYVLENYGVECSFISYTYDKNFINNQQETNLSVIRFYRPRDNIMRYHINALVTLFKFRKDFDILYLNGNDGQFWTASYLALFTKIFRKKIFMELNMEYEDPLSISGTTLSKAKILASSWVNQYICLSKIIKEKMTKFYPDLSAQLLFNGVDIEHYKPSKNITEKNELRKKLGVEISSKVVVACGAICKRKGIDFLLDAWQEVLKDLKNVKILFLGPFGAGIDDNMDDFSSKMLDRSKQDSFYNSVIFCGQVDNVEEYFKAADLFVFAGRQEGSPNVLREAMSSSLPVISLELEGITGDMIQNGVNGIIIPVADQKKLRQYSKYDVPGETVVKEFSENIIQVITNVDFASRLATQARKDVIKTFSIEGQAKNLISLM